MNTHPNSINSEQICHDSVIMQGRKTDKSLSLNGSQISFNAKAVESLRRSRLLGTPSNTSSGMNSPTILSNRSEKSSSGPEPTPPIVVNPYLQPRKDITSAASKPAVILNDEGVSTDNSIDEYWLGYPTHSKGKKGDPLQVPSMNMQKMNANNVFTLRRDSSPSVVSSGQRQRDNPHADSLNEFIELENTIRQQVDGQTNNNDKEAKQNKEKASSRKSVKINNENDAARIIQRWYRRIHADKLKMKSSLHQMMKEKHRQYSSVLVADREQSRKTSSANVTKKGTSNFSDQGRALRQKAIEELKALREQRRFEIERKAKEELARLENEGKVGAKTNRNKGAGGKAGVPRSTSARTLSTSSAGANANGDNAPGTSVTELDDVVSIDSQQQVFATAGEQMLSSSVAIARTKSTLEDLLSTLHQLEKDSLFGIQNDANEASDEKLPTNKTLAWLEEVEKTSVANTTRSDFPTKTSPRTEKFQEQPKKRRENVPTEGAKAAIKEDMSAWLPLPVSQRAESVTIYLDNVESSSRRIDDIDQTMAKQEEEIKLALKNMNSAAKIADLQQLERSSAEITSKCLHQQAELEAKQHTIKMLQTALNQQRELTNRQAKELERESKKQMDAQRNEYESAIQRHLSFIDQLIEDKKALSEKCEKLVTETRDLERKSTSKLKDQEEQHIIEIKKIREFEQAAEKLRREKWIAEREKRIKEATVKGLEPEIQRLIAQHKDEMKKLKSQHEVDMLAGDERAAQKYVKLVEELRQQLADEKEEACKRERELAKQRYESALAQERMQLQHTEKRLYGEVASERERLADQGQRQRSELESLQKQLEETHRSALELMRQEYDRAKKDQEEKHTKELKDFEERVKIEKQMWEEQYMKKQETWLMTKERELKEKVRTERDREIESVIGQLEGDTRRQREEIERSAESRVKRLREKYDSEINELERSERQTQAKYNETKARLAENEGELERVRAVLRQKEAELNDISSDLQKLRDERGRVADIVRQELADRLIAVEEENGRMKAELAEQKARSKSEAERLREEISSVQRSKEVELDEIHQRVKQAIAKKEEVVAQLRQQYEAAVRRADHLEGLLEQQRKQIIGVPATVGGGPAASARSGASIAPSGKK